MIGAERRVILPVVALISAIFITCSIVFRVRSICNSQYRIFDPSDFVILAAQLSVYGLVVCVVLQSFNGGQEHPEPSQLVVFRKTFLALQILYALAQGLVKLSTSCFYLRIFKSVRRPERLVRLILALGVSWSFSMIIFSFFMCKPLSSNWHPTSKGSTCANRSTAFVIFGVFDVLIDLMLVGLAISELQRLQMNMKEKTLLISIVGQAVLTIPISIIRTKSLTSVDYNDITNTATVAILTSLLEPTVGIITACAPNMKSVFTKSLSDYWTYANLHKRKPGPTERCYDYEHKYPVSLEDGVTIGIIFRTTGGNDTKYSKIII